MEKKDWREELRGMFPLTSLADLLDITNLIQEVEDRAREEGRKYALKEVEYTLAKDTRYEFLFTEIKDILSKLTTK